jgi:uncharacterized protein (DUF2062 family)
MKFFDKLKQLVKKNIDNLKRHQVTPHYIALGMGIGIFVSATPFFPFHTPIAVILAIFLRGSKIAAGTGVWLSNPITMPAFYFSSYRAGKFFMGNTEPINMEFKSFTALLDVTWTMLVGGTVIGIFLGIASYFLTWYLVIEYRKKKRHQHP